jgi:hypothetical protein
MDPMESLFEAVLCPVEGCSGRVASRMSTLHGRCGVCSTSVDVAALGAVGKKVRLCCVAGAKNKDLIGRTSVAVRLLTAATLLLYPDG